MEVLEWGRESGLVRVTGAVPLDLLPPPWRLPEAGKGRRYGAAEVMFLAVREDGFDVRITAADGELPQALIPADLP